MATIYVKASDAGASDSNAGTDPSAPKATIQSAIEAADDSAPAVVIILDSETYGEQLNVGTDGGFTPQNITIKGDTGQLPVLDGQGNQAGGIRGTHGRGTVGRTCTGQNMKFTRHAGATTSGGVFQGNGSQTNLGLAFVAIDCEFVANTTAIFMRTGGNSDNHNSANRCKFTENTKPLVDQHSGTGPGLGDMFIDFVNCVFGITANTEGIDLGTGTSNGTVKNCSFVTNTDQSGHHIILAAVIENTVVQNLASTSNHLVGIQANSSRSNNATFGNFATAQTGGTDGGNNLEGQDPLFTDTTLSNPDLSIPSNSPLVDAGKTISAITVDFNGVTRPQNANYDIGAFELELPAFYPANDAGEKFARKFGSDSFSIHSTANMLFTRKFALTGSGNDQGPFFLSNPSPVNLRERTDPYKNET